MQLSFPASALSVSADEPNLIATGGLLPAVALADKAGLRALADEYVSVGPNPGAKAMTLVMAMMAGADSISDLDLLRHGGMSTLFTDIKAPSTIGSFLRQFGP